jgi:hypothetical protein
MFPEGKLMRVVAKMICKNVATMPELANAGIQKRCEKRGKIRSVNCSGGNGRRCNFEIGDSSDASDCAVCNKLHTASGS